jgi:hypothetical protein
MDPVQEWQRLAAAYREKSPEELLELARDFTDLTETAQQALRSEMRSRGLGDPETARAPREAAMSEPVTFRSQPPASIKVPPIGSLGNQAGGLPGFGAEAPQLVPDSAELPDDGGPHDYTWKTPLCDCYTQEEAAQLQEALRRAGIESWFNFGGYTSSFVPTTSQSVMFGDIQVLVAADQLDQARAIVAQPIPQAIVDESKEEIPDFVEPNCPKCGSDDVVLEGVDPENTWRCEQCDAKWTDSMPGTGDGTPEGAKRPQ